MQQILECLVFTAICNLLALALLSGVRRWVPPDRLRQANDASSAYFAVIGTMYAVILGFMLVECWDRFVQVTTGVQTEAICLVQVYRLADTLPADQKLELREGVIQYCRVMVDIEWSSMDHGEMSTAGDKAYDRLWELAEQVRAPNNESDVVFDKLMDAMVGILQGRHFREQRMKAGLPPLLWAVLIVGAVLVISFSCVLGVDRYRLHALKLCALTSLICVTLFAIEEIDGPFSGSLRISSAPFSVLIHRIELNPLSNETGPGPSSAPSSR